MSPAAELSHIRHQYSTMLAVDDVSLTINPGQIIGLLGANGAGKTTLLRILLGLLQPTSGTVHIQGKPPSRRVRRDVGYVPQSLGLYNDLTVAENLKFITGTYKVAAPALPAGLLEVADRPVRGIGLGRQRRLAFLAALAHRPALLVLDEPTSGVDPLARARLWDTIHAQAERGAAIVVTTHYMQEADQCDHLVLLAGGREVASGDRSTVLGGATSVLVRADRWQDAFTCLDQAQLPVILSGTTIRVPGVAPAQVQQTLTDAAIVAQIETVPATIDEMLLRAG